MVVYVALLTMVLITLVIFTMVFFIVLVLEYVAPPPHGAPRRPFRFRDVLLPGGPLLFEATTISINKWFASTRATSTDFVLAR